MSTVSRQVVMQAVLDRVMAMTFAAPINGATTWRLVSNRLKLWGDVPLHQQPSAMVVTHDEMDEYRGIGLYRRRLRLGIWCYSSSKNAPGAPDLDAMMEAFEAAFNTVDNFSTGSNTLGGLVYWCRIEGRTFKDPGDIDNQTLLIVPLLIEMP